MIWAIYESDGRIDSIFRGAEQQALLQLEEGNRLVEVTEDVTDETHFVDLDGDTPISKSKRAFDVSYGVAGLTVTLQSLPYGSVVMVGPLETVADESPVEIEFDAPGTYEIRIYPPPQYRDEVLEVTVG